MIPWTTLRSHHLSPWRNSGQLANLPWLCRVFLHNIRSKTSCFYSARPHGHHKTELLHLTSGRSALPCITSNPCSLYRTQLRELFPIFPSSPSLPNCYQRDNYVYQPLIKTVLMFHQTISWYFLRKKNTHMTKNSCAFTHYSLFV